MELSASSEKGENSRRKQHGWNNNNNHYLLPLFMNFCRMCLSCLALFILTSILLLCWSSSLTSVKIHRKLLPQWDFSHIFGSLGIWKFMGGLPIMWENWLLFATHKQTLSQIKLLSCTSLSSAGSDRAQADLHSATLKLLHGRPAIVVWWMDGYQPVGLHSGSDVWSAWYREAAKLFCIYKSRFEVWLEVWGRLLSGLGRKEWQG